MVPDSWAPVEPLRQPEYTGSNRCFPCTVLNCCIAAILAGLLALASPVFGGVVFGVSLGVIYVRGYLVPGTPALTERYFPVRLLRPFGKAPAARDGGATGAGIDGSGDENVPNDGIGGHSILDRVGLLAECPEVDDLCLDPDFRRAWRESITAIRSDGGRQRALLVDTLDAEVDPSAVSLDEDGHRLTATAGGVTVGEWLSRPSFLADVAASTILAEWDPDWTERDARTRGSALARLRIFLERCPSCDAPVTFEEGDGSACCWSREVTRVRCTGCEARLLEIDRLAFDDGHAEYV